MRISKDLVTELSQRGYTLRPTFGTEVEQRKRAYHEYMNYCGMRLEETPQNIAAANRYASNFIECHWWQDSTSLFIFHENAIWEMKNLSKYKGIYREQIEKFIAKQEKAYNSSYGEFTKRIQNLLAEKQISGMFSIYPTTYGIGVWVFCNFNAKENVKTVENLLKAKGVEYYTEFSDARWVYRFKISKKQENLARIY